MFFVLYLPVLNKIILFPSRPISIILEPILKEPGSVSFSWIEIKRTKASLVQQISHQTNNTANETLHEFGLYPKDGECEHICPELNACISSNLWCDVMFWLKILSPRFKLIYCF